jgi:hypothetical protein
MDNRNRRVIQLNSILYGLFVIGVAYFGLFLFNGISNVLLNGIWVIPFTMGIAVSLYFIIRFKKERNVTLIWSFVVMALSVGCLGLFCFSYYLVHIIA